VYSVHVPVANERPHELPRDLASILDLQAIGVKRRGPELSVDERNVKIAGDPHVSLFRSV